MKEQLEYLMTSFDFHMSPGGDPIKAFAEALQDYAFVYHSEDEDGRLPISRASERVLHHLERQEPLPKPIRKYVKHEPLTVPQLVITDAVKALASSGQKITALKLVRGAYSDTDGGPCRLTVAKEIFDSIMARR